MLTGSHLTSVIFCTAIRGSRTVLCSGTGSRRYNIFIFQDIMTLRATLLALLLILSLQNQAAAEWALKRLGQDKGMGGGRGHCVLESERVSINDGYQDIKAHIKINNTWILVVTESVLDPTFKDIGLQVDEGNQFFPMCQVVRQRTAMFEREYASIIEQMKKGKKIKIQLRFWPTWPVTGTHDIVLSLDGFAKAYEEMLACE